MFRVSADTPWWSAGLTVRTALQALADTLARYTLSLAVQFPILGVPDACFPQYLPQITLQPRVASFSVSASLGSAAKPCLKHVMLGACIIMSMLLTNDAQCMCIYSASTETPS